jgi:hypothetical protein
MENIKMGNESSLVPEIKRRALKGGKNAPFKGKAPSDNKSTNVKNNNVKTKMKDTGRS